LLVAAVVAVAVLLRLLEVAGLRWLLFVVAGTPVTGQLLLLSDAVAVALLLGN